jgi:hypothetical protein
MVSPNSLNPQFFTSSPHGPEHSDVQLSYSAVIIMAVQKQIKTTVVVKRYLMVLYMTRVNVADLGQNK